MPYDFAVRITRPYDDFARVVARWALECDKMVVYQHTGSRTAKVHIHLAIEGSRICREQLRNIANTILTQPCKGQGDWSFKVWDKEERYIVYMTKGQHDPMYNKGYDDVYLSGLKSKYKPPSIKANPLERIYVSVFEDAQSLKEVYEMNLECGATNLSFIKWVRNSCLTQSLQHNNTRLITPKVRQDAITLFITYCKEHNVKITDEKDPMFKHSNLF